MKRWVKGGFIGFIIWIILIFIFFTFKLFGINLIAIMIISVMLASSLGLPIDFNLNYIIGLSLMGIIFMVSGMLIGFLIGKIKSFVKGKTSRKNPKAPKKIGPVRRKKSI